MLATGLLLLARLLGRSAAVLSRSGADNPILPQSSETHPLAHVLRLRTAALRWQRQDVPALLQVWSLLFTPSPTGSIIPADTD